MSVHAELPVVAFLCAAFLSVALVRHWRSGSVPSIAIVTWLLVLCIIIAVDAIVWSGNVNIVAPVWCDITTKLIMGSYVGIPAACLCLCLGVTRHAERPEARSLPLTARSTRAVHLVICLVPTLLYMALHFIVQDHRFDIIEDIGCRPAIYMSIPSLFIIWIPQWALSIAVLFLAYRALRLSIAPVPEPSYEEDARAFASLKAVMMAMTLVAWTTAAFTAYLDFFLITADGVQPWPSFAAVHAHHGRIEVQSKALTPGKERLFQFFLWWTVPAASLLVLAFTIRSDDFKIVRSWLSRKQKTVDAPTELSRMSESSCDTIATSEATIKFGPHPHDFFTVPNYQRPTTPPTVIAPISPTTTPAGSPPSFLPSLLSHSAFTHDDTRFTPPALRTTAPSPEPPVPSTSSAPRTPSGPQQVPEPHCFSSYSSSWLKLSDPAALERSISISSERMSVPRSPGRSSFLPSTLDGLHERVYEPRVPPGLGHPVEEFQLELSAEESGPRRGDGAIYMTVKESV